MPSTDKMVHQLTEIGIALTSIRDLDELLEHIVRSACRFTHCDGGTVYIREDSSLRLAVWENETLRARDGHGGEVVHEGRLLPIDETWMGGYVAATGKGINIGDVYVMPKDAPFGFNPAFDTENNYRTQSMLCVPMLDNEGGVVGALQLINALDTEGRVTTFAPDIEPLVRSLASQAAVAIRNAQLHKQLRDAHIETVFRMSILAELRDQETSRHIQRISAYSHIVAQALGFDRGEAELLRIASPMHDIGKIGIPDAILRKPGKLTDEEFRIMQDHTVIGEKVLRDSEADMLQASAVVAASHHEKWNGRGYPYGLAGLDIPLYGRVVALVDAFDAISSKRVYKPAQSFDESVSIVQGDRETHFCPECVDAFMHQIDRIQALYDKLSHDEDEQFQWLMQRVVE